MDAPALAGGAAPSADDGHGGPQARAVRARLADALDALLPQTQCRRCGYDGCRPYAEALAERRAPLNRCPPGGDATIAALASRLGETPLPLAASLGRAEFFPRARVLESSCIGCTLCIQACPVDAIVGARQRMHTVLAERCTGCGLCLPPCPVDCIELIDEGRAWSGDDARRARQQAQARVERLGRKSESPDRDTAATAPVRATLSPATAEARRAAVLAARERARARRAGWP